MSGLSRSCLRKVRSGWLRASGVTFVFLILMSCEAVLAQNPIPENLAPPPVRTLTKEEKKALETVTDHKSRTKLALELMEARLRKAEELGVAESFSEAVKELAGFQALMSNTIQFLQRSNNGSGSVLNSFKRFELALRAFSPRIESIRRETPERFEYHVREVLRGLRDARSSAVEPLFGNTVLPTGN